MTIRTQLRLYMSAMRKRLRHIICHHDWQYDHLSTHGGSHYVLVRCENCDRVVGKRTLIKVSDE